MIPFWDQQTRYFQEEDLQKELRENSRIVEVTAGSLLIDEGVYLKTVPIILEGSVKVFRTEEDKEVLLYYIHPHESCIMSIAVTYNNEKTAFKAVAEEDCTLLLLPAQLIPSWQTAYESFNLFINDLYKKRFEDLLQAFNSVVFQKMDDRLIAYLRHRVETTETPRISSTHQNIADELGIARETVSRLLKKLEQDGIVSLGRGTITILKKSALL